MWLPRLIFGIMLLLPAHAAAQSDPNIPNFWDPQERFIKPNVKDMKRLRFITTTDFPPFSFIDRSKRLAGFHVDLARAICEELDVSSVCQIQALPFAEVQKAITGGQGEAALAGIMITQSSREDLAFSRPYFWLPARFVSSYKQSVSEPLIDNLSGKSIGIVDRTAHAAYAKEHFGDMHLRLFENQTAALAALQKDKIAAVFGDGLSLSFWLQGEQKRALGAKTKACCRFIGGPYMSDKYFGNGLAVAMPKTDTKLEEAINYALRSINDKGKFAELYLRYFPISLF